MTRLCGFALAAVAAATAGCGFHRVDVPKEVAYVEANRDMFTDLDDHPLASIPVGTVMDDLGGLEGCWGRATPEEDLGPGNNNYKMLRFNLAENSLMVQFLARRPFDLDGVVEHVYSVELTSSDEITVQFLSASGDTFFVSTEPDQVEDSDPFSVQVALDNEAFKFGESSDPPGGPTGLPLRQDEVFLRFDCPE